MSSNTIDYAVALARLDEEMLRRFPGVDRSDPAAADRKLLEEGKLNENELLQLYSKVCGVEQIDEDEVGVQSQHLMDVGGLPVSVAADGAQMVVLDDVLQNADDRDVIFDDVNFHA